jgi:hypothetical protein
MDLSLPLIGVLGLIGYNLNKTPNSREYTDKRIKIPVSELQNGKTIYESKDYVRNQAEEQTRLDKFYGDENTIISTNRSKIKINSTEKGGKNFTNDFPENPNTQRQIIDKNSRIHNGPMFKEGAYYSNEVEHHAIKEKFDSDVSELSGLKTDFTHTNMQPFFGSNVKQPTDGVSVLDKYTGRNFMNKREVEMKKPDNKQDINGMPLYTDLVDLSRFDVGRSRNNVLPFKQYKEQPIPPEFVRGEEKTVDQLRPLSKPKATDLEARINHGSGDYVRPVDPQYVKNRPETAYLGDFNGIFPTFNKGREYMYAGRSEEDQVRYTSKAETTETQFNQMAPSNTRGNRMQISTDEDDKKSSYYIGSKHFEMANDWIRNAQMSVPLRDENIQDTHVAYEQERETTNVLNFGNAFDARGDTMRSLDKPKTTNKELTNYSYMPSAQSQTSKAPVGREFYHKITPKTKPTREYFAGGVKKFTPQSSTPKLAFKSETNVKDYTGPAKMNNLQSPKIGSDTKNKKYVQMETDFTYRLN